MLSFSIGYVRRHLFKTFRNINNGIRLAVRSRCGYTTSSISCRRTFLTQKPPYISMLSVTRRTRTRSFRFKLVTAYYELSIWILKAYSTKTNWKRDFETRCSITPFARSSFLDGICQQLLAKLSCHWANISRKKLPSRIRESFCSTSVTRQVPSTASWRLRDAEFI